MLCKFKLIINEITYQLSSSDIKNWKEISYSIKRVDYGGTKRTFTSKFEFVNNAYDLLFAEYRKNYLNSKAIIEVYTITNNHGYDRLFSCPLDFSSLNIGNMTLSMNAIDDSIASLLKAKKSTQYEIPVSEIKNDNQFYYDRILIFNSVKYFAYDKDFGSYEQIPAEEDEIVISYNGATSRNPVVLPLMSGDESEMYNTSNVTLLDNLTEGNNSAIMKFNATMEVEISMDFHVKRSSNGAFNITANIIEGSMQHDFSAFYKGNGNEFDVKGKFKIPGIYSRSGNLLKITFTNDGNRTSYLKINKFKEFSVKYTSIDKPVLVDVISPINLLSSIIKNINEDSKDITCMIATNIDDRLDKSMIVAAESLRGIPEAKIYTSYNKFTDWMEAVFGFIPVVDEERRTVTFTKRDKLFGSVVSKEIVNIDKGTSFSLDSSLICSTVKIGYDKQDYNSINGRDEFHFTNEYTTGITLSDKTYELISPFRADPYGIEFLVQERGKDTTDNDSDNDVFFVCAELKNDKYLLLRNGYNIEGVLDSSLMFNAMYSPRSMVGANSAFIGVFAKKLKFASSDGNSDVVINGVNENGDIDISSSLFTVGVLKVTTDDDALPADVGDLVRTTYDGNIYLGYIDDVSCKYGQYDGMKYKLLVKSIE